MILRRFLRFVLLIYGHLSCLLSQLVTTTTSFSEPMEISRSLVSAFISSTVLASLPSLLSLVSKIHYFSHCVTIIMSSLFQPGKIVQRNFFSFSSLGKDLCKGTNFKKMAVPGNIKSKHNSLKSNCIIYLKIKKLPRSYYLSTWGWNTHTKKTKFKNKTLNQNIYF